MRVRRRSGQLYCRQRHHCVATNPPQHRTIACTRDTYRSLQTFSTLLGSRNLQSTLASSGVNVRCVGTGTRYPLWWGCGDIASAMPSSGERLAGPNAMANER